MIRGFVRCTVFCTGALLVAFLAVAAFTTFVRSTASRVWVGSQPLVYSQESYGGLWSNRSGFDTSWRVLTSPAFSSGRPSVWVDPQILPVYRVLYAVRNFVTTPIVLLCLGAMASFMLLRRKRNTDSTPPPAPARSETASAALDAGELRNRRREALIIRRMYRVMDRIESRVERLESALLP